MRIFSEPHKVSSSPSNTGETTRLNAAQIAALAHAALVSEARLTPKPGLVDSEGSGAHHDLNLGAMLRSAEVLQPWFFRMATYGALHYREELPNVRIRLAELGREAEREMLQATGGSNAHRGAIWSLGLLSASLARLQASEDWNSGMDGVTQLCQLVAAIAALPDTWVAENPSHGDLVRNRYGVPGARAQAQSGFADVRMYALPVLACGEGSIAHQRLNALMALMAQVNDSCLLHRAGWQGLKIAQQGATEVQALGGVVRKEGRERLRRLDLQLLQCWASPGGSADLLAVAIFLDALAHSREDWLLTSTSCPDEFEDAFMLAPD